MHYVWTLAIGIALSMIGRILFQYDIGKLILAVGIPILLYGIYKNISINEEAKKVG